MHSRSARGPLVIGLGAAAILAASTSPAFADTPAPTPSESGTSPSASPSATKATPSSSPTPTPTLHVFVTPEATKAHGGDSVVVDVSIYASSKTATDVTLALTVGPNATFVSNSTACKLGDNGTCHLKDVTAKPVELKFSVTITKSFTNGHVPLQAVVHDNVSADGFKTDGRSSTSYIKVTPAPTPSPSATKTTPKASASASSSSASKASGSVTGAVSNNGSSSAVPSPSVALPAITQGAASPSVAPDGLIPEPAGSTTALRSGTGTEDLTFERLASTQAAWLAALLVAFSVLLTQVRLGRRPNAAAAVAQFKGAHRRSRKGAFEA